MKEPSERPPPLSAMDLTWIRRLLDSYAFWLKRDLVERTGTLDEQCERLFLAPFVVVSHANTEDPVLNYGNRQALVLWEMTWPELIATPLASDRGAGEPRRTSPHASSG